MADTELTALPVCPYCYHAEIDAWEIDFGGAEGDTVHTCGSCGMDYHLSKSITVRYTSKEPTP